MSAVAIVTDTTAYLPPALVEEHGIKVVSLYIVWGAERTEPEAELSDLARFFEELDSVDTWPTTSQPSVGDFTAVYEPLLAEGKDVVSVHISAGLSGTCEAARQAAEALERDGKGGERVRVIDSETAAGGLGILALAGARAANEGADLNAVIERTERARAELKIWFAVDTLEFLKRGGRIGAASAWIGSTLKVKPILSVESEMVPVERVRTSGRAFERMVDYARQREASGADGWVVQHIQAQEQAASLVERCREIFGCEPIFTSEIGPVLAVHTGPGLLGVGGLSADLLA